MVPASDPVEATLQTLLAGFDPERTAGRRAWVRIDVAGAGGTARYLAELDGAPALPGQVAPSPLARLVPFDSAEADVSLGLGVTELELLAGGELDLMEGFRAGRIRLSGNMTLARDLPRWLGLGASQ